jgi:hypothetical protein
MGKARWACLALVLALLCSGCSRTSEPPSRHLKVPVAAQGVAVTKVLVVVVENHSLPQMSAQMPYSFSLAKRFGYAKNYFAVVHPSLPNYLAMTSGSTHGISDDAPPSRHPLSSTSVFAQALQRGKTAGVYADGMPGRCVGADGGNGYAVKHNPWAYYVKEHRACEAGDKPLTALSHAVSQGSLPNVGMVIPNMCHDAHNCSLSVADTWIRGVLRGVFKGPDWKSGHLAIVITADEDDRHHHNKILTVVVHPSQHAHVVSTRLNHYSLSRLLSQVVHAQPLGRAAGAPSMSDAFGLPLG